MQSILGLPEQNIFISSVKIFRYLGLSIAAWSLWRSWRCCHPDPTLSWTTSIFQSCLFISHPTYSYCLHSSDLLKLYKVRPQFCLKSFMASYNRTQLTRPPSFRSPVSWPPPSPPTHLPLPSFCSNLLSTPTLVLCSGNTPKSFPTWGSLLFLFLLHIIVLHMISLYHLCLCSNITSSKKMFCLP